MYGIKFFSIKGGHLSLKSLADLFLIAVYANFLFACKDGEKKLTLNLSLTSGAL